MSYTEFSVNERTSTKGDESTLASLGVTPDDFLVCFFGCIGHQFDFGTVLRAAECVKPHPHIKFILCGDGPSLRQLRRRAIGLPNVLLPGWLEAPDIQAVMRAGSVGLLPYRPFDCFKLSISNKFAEYLAGGLAIACGVEGEMAALTSTSDCGFVYAPGDCRALVQGLETLAGDRPSLLASKYRARSLFMARFASEAVFPDLCEHLESYVEGFSNSLARPQG